MLTRDHCDNCGSEFSEGRFVAGKVWCADCYSGRKPPVAMPPTPAQRQQLRLWCAPLVPATRQTPHRGPVQPQGAFRG
jgi:hypothetical protein